MSLPFHKDMFTDAFNEDSLVVAAKGLGIAAVMMKFVKLYTGGKELVFILHAYHSHQVMCDALLEDGLSPDCLPTVVNNETSAAERKKLYAAGGVVRATSRILIVDLLTKRLLPESVAGFLVGEAHRVSSTSPEAFILQMYRDKNKAGFIRAFSEAPESLSSGFNRLSKTLRALHVRRVTLWPRFHVAVAASLRRHAPEVIEVKQPLSSAMTKVQEAVISAMDGCLEELQTTTSLAITDLKMESSLTQTFDEHLRRQLDPMWNKLKPATKQVVADVKILRRLLDYLLRYDAVTLADFLESVRFANQVQRSPSMWLLSDAAQSLFTACHSRLYRVVTVRHKAQIPPGCVYRTDVNEPDQFVYLNLVLQPNPKWKLLASILKEVAAVAGQAAENRGKPRAKAKGKGKGKGRERPKGAGAGAGAGAGTDPSSGLDGGSVPFSLVDDRRGGSCVLVVVKDERTCIQLKTWLACGSRKMLEALFDRHLARQYANTQRLREAWEEAEASGNNQMRVSNVQLLLWLLAKQRHIDRRTAAFDVKRARERATELAADGERDNVVHRPHKRQRVGDGSSSLLYTLASASSKRQPQEYSEDFRLDLCSRLNVVIFPLSQAAQRHSILADTRPNFVVMYDADHGFIRQLEVFSAQQGSKDPLRIYLCVYDNSVEEQRNLTALKAEKQAFERLIFEKAHLTIPTSPSRGDVVSTASKVAPSWGMTLTDSRIGTNIMDAIDTSEERGVVVVDMREFRSRLPCLLYQAGFTVIPKTLEVGDYVLTRGMCFERKSIPDLYGSFASGRLFHQVEIMTRCYERPMLLIEFDEAKPFSLCHTKELPADILPHHIISKLSLLTLHFPTLRILWSRSPRDTINIIKALKYKQPQPDPEHAAAIGTEGDDLSSAILTTKEGAAAMRSERNDAAIDMLLRLPGVNRGNYRALMDACPTLAEVCALSQAKMVALVGPVNAAKLYTFVHKRPPSKRSQS